MDARAWNRFGRWVNKGPHMFAQGDWAVSSDALEEDRKK